MCFYNEAENQMSHTWTYAGDPNYFPYEDMLCDCGQEKWHKKEEVSLGLGIKKG